MNKYQILFLHFVFFSCTPITETNWSFLPPVVNSWESIQSYGGSEEDIANAVINTHDGGFAVVGNTESTDGDFSIKTRHGSDIFLMKFNSEKSLQWVKTYGGSKDDRGHGIVQLSDKGYALVGYSKSSDGDATVNKGQHDNWIIRTDENGVIIWEKSFGFLGHDHAYNILATLDGGLFFNGFLDISASRGKAINKNSARHGAGEFWIHKIDLQGNIEWQRYFGGSSNDRSYDSIQSSDGNYVIVGSSESQDFDIITPKGSYDIWVIKIDANGNLLWQKSIGGTEYDKGNAIIESSTGEYIILGQTFSSDGDIKGLTGSSDILLGKLSPSGNLKQLKTLGDSGFQSANALAERPDGTLVIVGKKSNLNISSGEQSLSNDVLLYYTLPNGSLIETIQLSGSGINVANDLAHTEKGKIIVVGTSESKVGDFKNNNGKTDVFIAFWH